jgi:hypothetical protein
MKSEDHPVGLYLAAAATALLSTGDVLDVAKCAYYPLACKPGLEHTVVASNSTTATSLVAFDTGITPWGSPWGSSWSSG